MTDIKDKSRVRRKWSIEDKVFFCKLLRVPTKYGNPKSISEVADEYAIAPKTLYQWLEIYESSGADGFIPEKRKVIHSKSKNHGLRSEIFHLSLINPDWSAVQIINHLSNKMPISIPTVQKILKDENCHSLKQRFAATERALTNKEIIVPKRVMSKLLKNNPYLYLYEINKEINGLIFLIKLLSLKNYHPELNGYLIMSLETKSLMTQSLYWDGKDVNAASRFIDALLYTFGENNLNPVYFKFDEHRLLNKLISQIDQSYVKILSNAYKFNTKFLMKKAFTPAIADLRANLLKNYQFKNLEMFQKDLGDYFTHDITRRIIDGYPCFGRPKYLLHKDNLINIEFESIKPKLSPGSL